MKKLSVIYNSLFFPPNHLINHPRITLNKFYDFSTDILINIVRNWYAIIFVLNHLNCDIYRLKKIVLVDAGKDEAAFIQGFGALGAGADTDGWERVAYGGEEAAFFRKGAGVGHHTEGVHLKTVVVVEAERLLANYSRI